MSDAPPPADAALALARNGDFAGALAAARSALGARPDDAGLNLFVGMLHLRLGDPASAIAPMRHAVELVPGDPAARLQLVQALIASNAFDEAERILNAGDLPPAEAGKLRGALHASRGAAGSDARELQRAVEANPEDRDSWARLGACLVAQRRPAEGAAALHRSLTIDSDQPQVWDQWVDAMIAAGQGETALADDDVPDLPAARLLDRMERPGDALARLQRHASENPHSIEAQLMLGSMLERRNRIDELEPVVQRIAAASPDHRELPLLQAKLALRRKRFADARDLADRSPADLDPGTRSQIIAEASDRLGEPARAWSAYAAMNALDGRHNPACRAEAEAFLDSLEGKITGMTPQWAADWVEGEAPDREPIVLLGFPRSGTTLLDTFLAGHPSLAVAEELPLWPAVATAAGTIGSLPRLSPDAIDGLRDGYWADATRRMPDLGERRLVDKFPFALVAAPYIHRLFPGAPIIFLTRHPCDVVLSCYFTRFQPTGAAAGFSSLDTTAWLYDGMMRFFARSRDLLPLNVHQMRYEDLVDDSTTEMRTLADFLDLDWTDGLADHQATAVDRGHIRTPSYAQVAEPLYRRSVERWRRYEKMLEPVLPLLRPWVEAFGYSI